MSALSHVLMTILWPWLQATPRLWALSATSLERDINSISDDDARILAGEQPELNTNLNPTPAVMSDALSACWVAENERAKNFLFGRDWVDHLHQMSAKFGGLSWPNSE